MNVVSSLAACIVGIVGKSKESVKDIENDIRVREYIDEGLTVINLISEKIL